MMLNAHYLAHLLTQRAFGLGINLSLGAVFS